MSKTTQNPRTIELHRRLPIGAELLPGGGVHFRVWAQRRKSVEVVLEEVSGVGRALRADSDGRRALPALQETFALTAAEDGYFAGAAPRAGAGTNYRFRLDGGDTLHPDPASRFQPEGPHGPSQVVNPAAFAWTDKDWPGVSPENVVLYEMHIGTFTPEGTWKAAERELAELAHLGVTCLEVMPVAEFPGKFGWGYDGVDLFAPSHLYGTPDDFRQFVDRAHSVGIGVILDVVYNHIGPDGNYLKAFSQDYFTDRYKTDWGEAINFDGANSTAVREFFLSNSRYWIEEFHLDGFRFDATQNIYDSGDDHILAAVARTARAAAGQRKIYLVNENEPQHTRIVRPHDHGGYGMDALWNDDFHHSAFVRMTGRAEAYCADYTGSAQEFISVAKFGYLFQGQRYSWQKQRRGTPTFDLAPSAFINFIENHDQLANLARGARMHKLCSPAELRAMTALMLLAPGTPMLFQGQEFATDAPFHFFADHNIELARLVRKGRAEFCNQFPSLATAEVQALLMNPDDPRTFEQCKLDLSQRSKPGHAEVYQMHRDLLTLRRTDAVFRGRWPGGLDGAVLGDEALVLRYFGAAGDDRLVLVNFGRQLNLNIVPEPLLAPPLGKVWETLWSSEDPRYLGQGVPPVECDGAWTLPGHATVVMKPIDCPPDHRDAAFYLASQRVKSS